MRDGIQHAIVLGDPGYGKTMLLLHEVGRRNENWHSRIERSGAGLLEAEVSVFVRAVELAQWLHRDEGVLDALIRNLREHWQVSEATLGLCSPSLAVEQH